MAISEVPLVHGHAVRHDLADPLELGLAQAAHTGQYVPALLRRLTRADVGVLHRALHHVGRALGQLGQNRALTRLDHQVGQQESA